MRNLSRTIRVSLIVTWIYLTFVHADEYEAHHEYFAALCGFYGVAEASPETLQSLASGVADKSEESVQEIRKILKSVDPSTNETPSVPSTPEMQSQSPAAPDHRQAGDRRMPLERLKMIPQDRHYYGAKLSRLMGRALEKWKGIEADTQAIGGERAKISTYLQKAKWGQAKALAQVTLDGARANACGYNKDGEKGPGNSLANDIACICVVSSSAQSATTKLCSGEGKTHTQQWATNSIANDYADLLAPCTFQRSGGLSVKNIQRLKFNFTRLFGTANYRTYTSAALDTPKKFYTYGLGHGSMTEATCAGGSADTVQEICVNYLKVVSDNGTLDGIAWFNQFSLVEAALEEIGKLQADVENKKRDLENMNHTAWEIYFDAERQAQFRAGTASIARAEGDSTASNGKPATEGNLASGAMERQRGEIIQSFTALLSVMAVYLALH